MFTCLNLSPTTKHQLQQIPELILEKKDEGSLKVSLSSCSISPSISDHEEQLNLDKLTVKEKF